MNVPWRRVAGVVLALAASGAVVQSYLSTVAHQRYVECQVAVNDTLIARTHVLTVAADDERLAQRAAEDATRDLFTDPVLSKPAAQRTPAEQQHLLDLFAAYQLALTALDIERRDADAARAQNPIPEPPSTRCG